MVFHRISPIWGCKGKGKENKIKTGGLLKGCGLKHFHKKKGNFIQPFPNAGGVSKTYAAQKVFYPKSPHCHFQQSLFLLAFISGFIPLTTLAYTA